MIPLKKILVSPLIKRLPYCHECKGTGVKKIENTYHRCECGRLPNANGAARLAKQHRLTERLREVKEGRW